MSCTDICTYHKSTISKHGSIEELQINTNDEAFLRRMAIKYAQINQRISAIESRLIAIILERNLRLRNENTTDNNVKLMRTFSTTVMNSLDTLTELNGKLTTIISDNLNSSNSAIESKKDRLNESIKMAYEHIVNCLVHTFNYFRGNCRIRKIDTILWLVVILFALICFD